MNLGAFTFVLHSHLPYVRRAGRWPHGEEWIHEAIAETYVPLLIALHDLAAEGISAKITLGITPVLAEQLSDPLVLEHFTDYIETKIKAAESDMARWANEPHLKYLAQFYHDRYTHVLRSFQDRFNGDLIGAFKTQQDAGHIEILTSAATHGYLPLLSRDSSIHAQLAVGVQSYRRHFGRAPRAIWLPECAYRPAYYAAGRRYTKPGLESFLAELGLKLFFSETHAVEGGRPVGKAAGDALGPYGDIPKRYLVPLPDYVEPTQRTTHLPYYVAGVDVAVIARNNRTGMQVWSAEHGYPGDFWYREFHKKDGTSGLQYWRVSGARLDLAHKAYYEPRRAQERVHEHAAHFCRLVESLTTEFHAQSKQFGIIASNYDTELFGHWWFEGVDWLREALRHLARSEIVQPMTASEYLAAHPPRDVLALPESSWGQAGNHFTWMNADTEWMWPIIHAAERRMEALVARHPQADDDMRALLGQAARELLLLQSSDWPFLVTTGQAREYAVARFQMHVERFEKLAALAEAGRVNPELVEEYWEMDNVFEDVDYRVFGEREGNEGNQGKAEGVRD